MRTLATHAVRKFGATVLPKVSQYRGLVETYTNFYKNETVVEKTVLYESRDGKSLTDSPFAIFDYLLKIDMDQEYTHIWSVTPGQELDKVKELYQDKKNVIFVNRNSEAYLKWLTKAEFLINNSTFQAFVTIKENQTYINTWHGTPLKTMGFDIPGNPADAKNVVRNFFMADYLISPNAHTTDMFLKSYRLNDNFQGRILETGYPRIDLTMDENKDDLLKMLFDFGVSLDLSKKILLYTPTCKMGDLSVVSDEVSQIHEEMALVRSRFGSEYNVLIKTHPYLYDVAKKNTKLKEFLIPDVIDTNKLLGIVDILITDYSSIFFDFLVTEKPILFYCWDDDLYSNNRGKYFEYDELPGSVAFNIDELITNLENIEIEKEAYQNNYMKCQEKFTAYDDGHVTERVVDIIFNQKSLSNVIVIEPDISKKSLFIYPGGLRNNGITSSFLNLMQSIDFDEYRVVLLLDNMTMPEQINNFSELPKQITPLFRYDVPLYTAKEHQRDLKIHFNGVKKGQEMSYPDAIYQRDLQRFIGNQRFDVAIDFSGYSLHWSKMIIAATAKKHICYLHSDMMLDLEREVNGKKIHKTNLSSLFTVYDRYDKLVSVSEAITEVNKNSLEKYAAEEKFVYATNAINIEKILAAAKVNSKKEVTQTELFIRKGTLAFPEKKLKIKSTRPDMRLGKTQEKYVTSDEVSVLGRFENNNKTFYKISQDHIYLGWVESETILVSPVRILSDKQISSFGKLNTYNGDYFYSEPIGLEKNTTLSSAEKLRNVYVDVTREATTEEGTSVLVMLKGKQLGWLPKNKVTWSNKLSAQSRANPVVKAMRKVTAVANYTQYKDLLVDLDIRPLKKELLADYFRPVGTHKIIAYEKPSETGLTIEMDGQAIIFVQSLSTTSTGRWFEILTENSNTLWVKENQLQLTNLKEEEVVIERDVSYLATARDVLITVYPTIADCLANKGQEVKALEMFQVLKEIKTSLKREFLFIRYDEKSLWVDKQALEMGETTGVTNAENQFFSYPNPEMTNIVTVGRLSPEKNQIALVQAFKGYQEAIPNSHLYIVGGGAEEGKLEKEINQLDLGEKVTMLGQVYNPFEFMGKCDIFALTSLYEGQSMVLIEALTLNMKCLSTDIPACRNVLEDGAYGLLTKTNDTIGITEGLKRLTNKEKKEFKLFDPYEYNCQAMNQFYQQTN